MPIYDNNGSTSAEIKYLYDNDGTANSQIRYVYDNNGSSNALIYSSETNLWVNGATSESGSWSTTKNSIDRGQTITFGTTIGTTTNSNSNSSHGVLIYPANKVAVSQGDTISLSVSRHNEWCPDTNVGTWTFYITILYLSSVPSDFHSTFDINSWVSNQSYKHYVQSTSKGGSSGTQSIRAKTFTATVPISGSYYVCLCIHGYDSVTNNLALNNFKIE